MAFRFSLLRRKPRQATPTGFFYFPKPRFKELLILMASSLYGDPVPPTLSVCMPDQTMLDSSVGWSNPFRLGRSRVRFPLQL